MQINKAMTLNANVNVFLNMYAPDQPIEFKELTCNVFNSYYTFNGTVSSIR